MSALYVFALTNQAAPPLRYEGHRIEFVEVAEVYAAVERVADRPAVSEAALRAQHEIVLRIGAAVDGVLPARFGAFLDAQELEQLVTMRKATIREALELVSGRVQMTVRVFTAEAAPARSSARPIEPAVSGTAYLEQRRRESAGAAVSGPSTELAAAVRAFVVAERVERGQGRVESTVYHLVNRDMVDPYKRAVAPFESTAVTVSGPWPPFAFVPDLWP
jgi:hypothetical protein